MRTTALIWLGGLAAAAALTATALLVLRDEAPRPAATPDPVATLTAPVVPAALPPSQAVPAARPAPAVAAAPAIAPAASRVRSSFGLSTEHRSLVEGTMVAAADLGQLEREERDNAWAPEAERLIRGALTAHPSFAGFDIVAIDCRQTLCAIQAFSYGDDGNAKWVSAFDELYRQSLAASFDSVNSAFPTQAGKAAVLTFLHRKTIKN